MNKTQIALLLSALMIAPAYAADPVKAGKKSTVEVTEDIKLNAGPALYALVGSKIISHDNVITGTSGAMGARTVGGELDLRNMSINLDGKQGVIGVEVKERKMGDTISPGKLKADNLTIDIQGGMGASQGIVAMDSDVELSNSKITVKGDGIVLMRSVASLRDLEINIIGDEAGRGLSLTDTILDNAENITINLISDKEVDHKTALINAVHVRGDADKTSLTLNNSTVKTNGGYSAVRVDPGLGFNAANTTIEAKGTGVAIVADQNNGQGATKINLSEGTTLKTDENVRYTVMGAGEVKLDKATVDSKSMSFAKGDVALEASNQSVLKIENQSEEAGAMTINLQDSTLEVGDKVELAALELDEKSRVEFAPSETGAVLRTKNLVNNNGTIVLNAKMVNGQLVMDRIDADTATGTSVIDLKVGEGVDLTGQDLRLINVKDQDAPANFTITSNAAGLTLARVGNRWVLDSTDFLMLPSSMLWGEMATRDARTGGALKAGDKGLWVRAQGEKAKSKRADHAKTQGTTLEVGYDKAIAPNWTGSVYMNVGHMTADFDKATNDVKNRRVGLGVVATRAFDNNAYVEFMLNASKDRFQLKAGQDKTKIHGRRVVASVEAGHRFPVGNLYVEPQAQVAYTYAEVKDYTLNNKTVGTDTFNGVAARLSVKTGIEQGAYNVWTRADLLPRMGGTLTASTSNNTLEEKTSGMGYGVAFGGAYRIGAMWQLTADAAATKHHGMKSAFSAGLGLKRSF